MRMVFMGSPEFAVLSLRAAAESGQLTGIITQPARGKGRGRKMTLSAVAMESRRMGIEPMMPDTIRTPDFLEQIRKLSPDIVVVVAYGKILPPDVLRLPGLGCVNVHASLLPELRGAAPIQWAVARGARETGVTLMQMDEGMDTGPVFIQERTAIGERETASVLAGRLASMAADILRKGLPAIAAGELTPVPQDDTLATCAPLLKREDGLVDWTLGSREVANRIRGFTPWPGTYSTLKGKRVLITSALPLDLAAGAPPGEILEVGAGGVLVACGDGAIRIDALKPEGKREMSVPEYLAGNRLVPGNRFGE
jgi:methionyl-tRNA formyltransferase